MNATLKWTAIFLVNREKQLRIGLLKRAAWKSFAPRLYTGIGGKIEGQETALEGARRELREETNLAGHLLKQFTQVVFKDGRVIHFFELFYQREELPACNEGCLEWARPSQLATKSFIPPPKRLLTSGLKESLIPQKDLASMFKRSANKKRFR